MGTGDEINNLLQEYSTSKVIDVIRPKKRFRKNTSNMTTWEEHIQNTYHCKCYTCPGLFANEVKRFVGFRGYKQNATMKSHAKGELFILDKKGNVYEGEAKPEPYVPISYVNEENLKRITGKTKEQLGRLYFLGVLDYEVEILTLKFTLRNMGYPHILILMGRGLGKTWMEDWENSIEMKYFARNILLLSESDAGKDVGDWIHTWAFENKILKATTHRQGGKRGSYLDFTLHNGSKLYVYGYMEKHSLGKHEIKIVMDDVVNLDWQNRPSDEKRSRQHWHSNLNHMNRIGLDIWGTRKYEGDLLGYFIKVLKDLIIIKISPFTKCPHQLIPNENGVYEECLICKDDNLLAPEIHSFNDYMDKKEENYDSWHSEQMQNPHRKEGGMVAPSDICYVNRPHWTDGVLLGGTGVDCADTTDVKNDMVGIVSCLSQRFEIEKRDVRAFTVYNTDVARRLARNSEVKEKKKPYDWIEIGEDGTEKHIVRGIFETVQLHCEFHINNYPHIPYIVAWERNRSGIAIMEQALREFRLGEKVEIEKGVWVKLTWPGYLVPDKDVGIKYPHDGNSNIKLGITHNTNKEVRVEGELKYSIINSQLRFTVEQKYTVFMAQLLGYPNAKHDDGPDACGMIKDELNRRWEASVPDRQPMAIIKETRKNEAYAKKFQQMKEPWSVKQRKSRRVL